MYVCVVVAVAVAPSDLREAAEYKDHALLDADGRHQALWNAAAPCSCGTDTLRRDAPAAFGLVAADENSVGLVNAEREAIGRLLIGQEGNRPCTASETTP